MMNATIKENKLKFARIYQNGNVVILRVFTYQKVEKLLCIILSNIKVKK